MNAARGQLLLLVGLALASRSCSLGRPHQEIDERIYRALSDNLVRDGRYSLRGTAVLQELEPETYDRPLFHHPPLFALLISPLSRVGPRAPVLVSWLGLVAWLVAIYLALWRRQPGDRGALALVGLFAVFDPVMSLVSTRIWMDALLAGLVATSAAALTEATVSWRPRWTITAALLLGLACNTKVAALCLLPLWLVVYLVQRRDRTALKHAALLSTIVVGCVVPWFVWFFRTYGVLLPGWAGTAGWDLSSRPFLELIAGRPAYFYGAQLVHMYPGLLVAYWVLVRRHGVAGVLRDRRLLAWTLWLVGGVCAVTLMSYMGHSYQMRFLVYVLPVFYLVLGTALPAAGKVGRLALVVTWAYTASIGGFALVGQPTEVFSPIEELRGAPLL